ncbi:alpha/beta hydrolase [soil metagenome]
MTIPPSSPPPGDLTGASRRGVVTSGLSLALVASLSSLAPSTASAATPKASPKTLGDIKMSSGFVTTKDGTEIFYKDWGPKTAQPIVFHHGWPLSADDWDNQMMFFVLNGYRVIAHDRRGHGRSSQTDTGNEMDTYAADVATLTDHLDLKNAIHVGHSTGGGEVIHYVARAKPGRVAKAVLIGAVPPIMVKSDKNPGGLPIEVFDGFRAAQVANRAQFFHDVAAGPFYGYNRPGAKVSQATIENWWRQGMMGGTKAHYDCIKAFSETDFTDDMKSVDVPVLLMHGEDDQIVPIADAALIGIKLLKKGTLKTYPGLPHGMATTHPEIINPDLLAFFKA